MTVGNSIAIQRTGMVASVGYSSAASCAAIRAKLTNATESGFVDSTGESILAHEVLLREQWRGISKIAQMAAIAIKDCVGDIAGEQMSSVPVLLCVAEQYRPGRLPELDDSLIARVADLLDWRFSADSALIPFGRVSALIALERARRMIYVQGRGLVLVVAVDSLLSWPTLMQFEQDDRLLTATNSNGFMPGEGACALLVSRPAADSKVLCTGIGFAMEDAHIESGEPLRGTGLKSAIKDALDDAECEMHDLDLRIADVSGEQYYFKEAALALSRLLRQRTNDFDIWHPAECTGEAGAMSGASPLVVAEAALRKGYAPGRNVLAHMSNDRGERAAAVLRLPERA